MHTTWKQIVLSYYPKVNISPEREIAGLGAVIDKNQGHLRGVTVSRKDKKFQPRKGR